MLTRLRRLGGFGLLRLFVGELRKLRQAQERIATALEFANARAYPQQIQPNPDQPPVEISYITDQDQAALMEAEMRLTAAKGIAPTEEEILAEYERSRGSTEAKAERALNTLDGLGPI